MYKTSTYTIALSRAIKDGILDIEKNVNIEIIPSASTPFTLNNKNIEEIKKRFRGKFVVGNIGELDNTHKGQFYLIEAAKKISLNYPDIHFLFLGKGKDSENYKEQASKLTNITFEGYVNNVGDYISSFDLFVFPSLNEGLGSILFDVMKQDVPIIASNVGGIPDIIENNKSGILLPTKNADAIYEAIEKLYKNKELSNELAINAKTKVDMFSPTVMADSYETIYNSIK